MKINFNKNYDEKENLRQVFFSQKLTKVYLFFAKFRTDSFLFYEVFLTKSLKMNFKTYFFVFQPVTRVSKLDVFAAGVAAFPI